MKKNLLYTALWLMGLMGTLAAWVTKAEYSQVINITWFDVDTPNQLIQSFTQKRDDLELYFVSNTWNISHYTIMDRNMWAEEVFNWDFDSYNTWSFWYQYQWWNNYWFEPCYENNCETFTNNSGFISTVPYEVWGAYMPSKYARNTRATGNPNVSNNDYRRENWMVWLDNNTTWKWNNIWWWSWDSYNWNWPWTAIDRKGPCPDGYYVPSTYDFEIFSKLRKAIWRSSFSLDLLLPLAWDFRESYNFKISRIGSGWSYLLSSPKSVYRSDFYSVRKDYWVDHPSQVVNPTARGLYIRCFKNLNNDLSTDFSLHLNWWTRAVIAFTGNVWEWKITTLSTPIKSNYIFLGRFDAEFDWNEVKTWSIVPNNLYARWWWCKDGYEENEGKTACLMKTYTITYNLNWWTNNRLNPQTYTVETSTIMLQDATRNWSIFDWWYSDEDFTTKVTSITKWNTWDINLYARWKCDDGFVENEEKTKCIKCSIWYIINQEWTACEKIRVDFDANGWKFDYGDTTFQKEISVVQIPSLITEVLHSPNLTDEWEYKQWSTTWANPDSCTYHNGGNWSGNTEIYGPSAEYIQIDWATELQLFIKYWWSSYCNPGPIWIWTWQHTDYDPRNPNHSGSSIRYLSNFPVYNSFWEYKFNVQWDSISIVQASWCPNYWRFATVSWTWLIQSAEYSNDTFDNIPQPLLEWYTFKWWYLADGNEFNTWNVSTWEITKVYAKWECAQWYEDKWWECVKKSSWSSGWGGRSNKTSDTQDSSTSSQNNKNTENVIQSETKWSEESSNTPMDSSDKSSEWQEILSLSDSSFTKEQKDAYEFAHEKWITTMPTIQEAQMDWKLTRIAMAKMLSQYAMNVLWQKPANIVTPKFNDVTDKQNSDYDDWVTLAYQLWIMWQNMPNNKFRPDDEVTRAEFATALSRMLYHTSDWQYKSTDKYYTNHMKKLVQEKIITNDDAKMKELRWYVMIMLMRSAK